MAWTESGRGGPRDDLYDEEAIFTPSSTTHVYLFHNYDVRRTTVSQVYQFRPGKRWHPFAGIALGLDREKRFDSRTGSVEAPRAEGDRQARIAEDVLFGGARATVSQSSAALTRGTGPTCTSRVTCMEPMWTAAQSEDRT